MNTLSRLVAAALVGVAAVVPDTVAAQGSRPGSGGAGDPRFVGSWKLVAHEVRLPDGRVVAHPRGPKPIGTLIYEPDGRMSVQIMNDQRAKPSSSQPGPDEQAAWYRSYTAYFGTYSINEAEGAVIHHVQGGLRPQDVGTDQKRFFDLAGKRLILKPPSQTVEGQTRTSHIIWERVR